jgi:hypothetical protein
MRKRLGDQRQGDRNKEIETRRQRQGERDYEKETRRKKLRDSDKERRQVGKYRRTETQ